MKFTHTADCHIGGHRDPRLKALTEQAFLQYVDQTIAAKVDFTIIAGDLFNTAIPGIDTLKFTVTQLNKFKQNNIPVYAIPGSHDFSPSGKTMLDVLEEAGLLINVCRGTITADGKLKLAFTQDKKTGVKLTGVIGKKGMLDRNIYNELDQSISNEPGQKIFLFHTSISELKPQHLQEMESYPVSFLPKNFEYYAGGHVHIVQRYEQQGYKNVIYPGPLFPNSFSELEKLQHGGYYLYENSTATYQPIILKQVVQLSIDADGIDAQNLRVRLEEKSKTAQVKDAIILLRLHGTLSAGNVAEVALAEAIRILEERGAFIVLRNIGQLNTKEFQQIAIEQQDTPHELEEKLLHEHTKELALKGKNGAQRDGAMLAKNLLKALGREPIDGEKVTEHQDRMIKDGLQIIDTQ